jgi:iron(III) transport system substrate-binding protein
VEVVYAIEGSPLIIVPSGIFRGAPNPNAAKLFQSFFFGAETQQLLVDTFAHRSFNAQVKKEARPHPVVCDKVAEGRPRPGAGAKRDDQSALQQAVRGVMR